MRDEEILKLYFDRSQQAVTVTQAQYGARLSHLAERLLRDLWAAEECVNDTYLAAWNAIPPQKPLPLLPWLYKALRNLAISRIRRETAQKRGGGGFSLCFEELDEMLASTESPQQELEARELARLLEAFLRRLSAKDRALFLGRYWFSEDYQALAPRIGLSEGNCAVRLNRIRKKLRSYLLEKGAL